VTGAGGTASAGSSYRPVLPGLVLDESVAAEPRIGRGRQRSEQGPDAGTVSGNALVVGERIVDSWKQTFLDKLHQAQSRCAGQFAEAVKKTVVPAYEELASFLSDNGFESSTPLTEEARRSFKFELAENAYVLVILRFSGIGEFELQTETFVPGAKPMSEQHRGRVSEVTSQWAQDLFRAALDQFVELLAKQEARQPAPADALAAV
jgi:hypothetical protein